MDQAWIVRLRWLVPLSTESYPRSLFSSKYMLYQISRTLSYVISICALD